MFLTPEQLEHLTGKIRPSAQAAWLTERGWRFELNSKGAVVVHEAEAERKLCGGPTKRERRPAPTEPDLDALN